MAGVTEWAFLELVTAMLGVLATRCDAVRVIVREGGVPTLFDLLARAPPAVAASSAMVLRAVADEGLHCPLLRAQGAVTALLAAVQEGLEEGDGEEMGGVIEEALLGLMALSADSRCTKEMARAGGMALLLACIARQKSGQGAQGAGTAGVDAPGSLKQQQQQQQGGEQHGSKLQRLRKEVMQQAGQGGYQRQRQEVVTAAAVALVAALVQCPEGRRAVVHAAQGPGCLVAVLQGDASETVKGAVAAVLLGLVRGGHVTMQQLILEGLLPALLGAAREEGEESEVKRLMGAMEGVSSKPRG